MRHEVVLRFSGDVHLLGSRRRVEPEREVAVAVMITASVAKVRSLTRKSGMPWPGRSSTSGKDRQISRTASGMFLATVVALHESAFEPMPAPGGPQASRREGMGESGPVSERCASGVAWGAAGAEQPAEQRGGAPGASPKVR